MRIYKRITIITGLSALISFVCCLILHYCFADNSETSFWLNVLFAVFGSALLTAVTSWVTYFHEKRQTMEGFVYATRRILKVINHYQKSMSLEEKVNFFLSYADVSKDDWDMQIGNMDFFFEGVHHHRRYIYNKIYMPILTFNQAVGAHVWDPRWYRDGSMTNEKVIDSIVKELEDMLITEYTKEDSGEMTDDGTQTQYTKTTIRQSKLVHEVQEELNGKYFDIMYGKKAKFREESSDT